MSRKKSQILDTENAQAVSRRNFMQQSALWAAAFAGAGTLGGGQALAAREKELNILCWEGYNSAQVLDPFRSAKGATVKAESLTTPLRGVTAKEFADAAFALREPGQISPYHCHPEATEIYFCFSGGGTMRTPSETVPVMPGGFVVHPPGEVHEYENGATRTLLFRVRYGADMRAHHCAWRGHAGWRQSAADAAYYRAHPVK